MTFLQKNPTSLLLYIGSAAVLIIQIIRLFYGIDFTDEVFFLSISSSFHHGGMPLIDEFNLVQFTSLLLFPFFKLYYFFCPSGDGIVLFFRGLYLLFRALIAAGSFAILGQFCSRKNSILLAIIVFIFPLNHTIHMWSYNSIGASTLFIGNLLLWLSVMRFSKTSAISEGVFHGIMAFSYPTLVIFSLFLTCWLWFLGHKKQIFYYILGGISVFLAVVILLHKGLMDGGLWRSFSYGQSFHASTRSFSSVFSLAHIFCLNLINVLIPIAAAGLAKYKKNPSLRIFGLTPLLVCLVFSKFDHNHFILSWGFSGVIFAAFFWNDVRIKNLFLMLWLPAVASAAVIVLSTSWGVGGGYLGYLSAFIASTFFFMNYAHHILNEKQYNLFLGALFFIISSYFLYVSYQVYRDETLLHKSGLLNSWEVRGLRRWLKSDRPLVIRNNGEPEWPKPTRPRTGVTITKNFRRGEA